MQRSWAKMPPPQDAVLPAWTLPLIVSAIAVSIVAGFYIAGPGLGMAIGALAASSIIVMAIRRPPRYPIVPASLRDFRRHLLVVANDPLEDAAVIEQIAAAASDADGEQSGAEVLVLASARQGFLDRWASDFGPAHQRAERSLLISLASLAKAGVGASARIGDEDLVQAVEDELRTFPATGVILVTGAPDCDATGNAAASELGSRLQVEFHHLLLAPFAKGGGTDSSQRVGGRSADRFSTG